MNISLKTRIKTRIHDARTGALLKESPWRSNLVMDQGLNFLSHNPSASQVTPAGSFTNLIVGGGTNPTSVSSGAITFTQSGTTLTASAGFFNAGMVGTLFKYGTGTGGAEYYITGYTDTQNVTVDTSATVGTPTVGVVWYVNQTGLQTYLHAATSYQTNAGDNSTTISAGQVTFQRTFIVPTQLAPYSVNEIGWNGKSLGDSTNTVNGRIVLGSTDVVGVTNYYVVVVQIIFNYTPAAPTAVLNVGTAINTAGTAMIESLGSIQQVGSNGTVTGSNLCLDGSAQAGLTGSLATYTQNSTPSPTTQLAIPTPLAGFPVAANWTGTGARGTMTVTHSFSCTTAGQTLYGIALRNFAAGDASTFDIKFTTPFVVPTGTFSGTIVWQIVYGRVLSN